MESIIDKIKRSKAIELRICFYVNGIPIHINTSKKTNFEVFEHGSDVCTLFVSKKTQISINLNQKYESLTTENGEKIEFAEKYIAQKNTFVQLNLFYR